MSQRVKVVPNTLLVLFAILLVSSSSSSSFSSTHNKQHLQEVVALLKWKSTLANQTTSLLSSWKMNSTVSTMSPCKWYGITCNKEGSVAELNVTDLGLQGNISNEIGTAGELRYLILNENNFSGTPPKSIGNLQYLKVLHLANNKFEGDIPTEFCSLRDLRILSLKSNKFNGSIPMEINHLHQLRILDLSQNSLNKQIPSSMWNLKKLTSRVNDTFSIDDVVSSFGVEMVIKGNILEVEVLSSYTSAIDLSCNNLDGNISKEISLLKGLYMLNLSHNHFTGNIPANIGDMSSLESLDLSWNGLDGHTPQSLSSMDSLAFLNLSYNKLSGKIPRGGHFETLSWDGSAVLGNDLLCGFPTNKDCEGESNTSVGDTNPITEVEEGDQEDAKERILFYGVIALGFGVGFWGLFIILLLKKHKWWFGYWRVIDSVVIRIIACIYKN
ncbi:probable leucine-rich repeat receptor-like protein kinase At5g63930 isoform X2 [Papaver somniferum]|uniref:probable leucine-rich repeat receptor-like protein kinase At5g63930 isoform X2 n=1 Tax=Papaver somniferum TaxID=3469 RepID=UPI000E6F6AB8|nr:probable leucine-rich repeat receptor-like protein kinase At5g63930 isoform X2 [Papaver somniferum]